jgi:hypothetical protein
MKIFRLVVAIALFLGAIAALEFIPVENDLLPAVEILCLTGGLVVLPMRWRDSDFESPLQWPRIWSPRTSTFTTSRKRSSPGPGRNKKPRRTERHGGA